MLDAWLVVAGSLGVLVAASSRAFDRLPVSEPIVALAVGVLLGPVGVDLLQVPTQPVEALAPAARLTLAVALMAIALRYPLSEVRARLPELGWLLAIVMPLMVITVAVGAEALFGLGLATAMLLGACLAPTDPVLASSVVSGEPAARDLPAPLRQALSLESAANDGLALPLVLVLVAVVAHAAVPAAVWQAAWSVVGAVLIGTVLGVATGRLLSWAERHGDVEPSRSLIFSLVLSLGALGLAAAAGTADLLAVFVTGLAFNASTPAREREAEEPIDEAVNRFLILPLFVLVGTALPWSDWMELGWRGVAFVLVALVLRRLPYTVLLRRPLRTDLAGAVWLGWFGPIGVAAVLYLTGLPEHGVHDVRLWPIGSLVVVASTLVHGVTDVLGRRWYARAVAARRRG